VRGSMREKRPGTWELRVSAGLDPVSKRYRYVSRTITGTKREAQRALATLVADVSAGRDGGSSATLKHTIERWLSLMEHERSATTLHEYSRLAEKRIYPALGAHLIRKITGEDLDRFYTALRDDGLSPGSIRQVHAVIRRSCAQAVKWSWISRNPAVDASPPSVRHVERDVTTTDHAHTLLAACADDAEMATMVRTAAATGARRGELCGLRRTDLHLDDGWLAIRRAVVLVGGRLGVKDTKTHAERQVDLDAGTIVALRAHLEAMDKRAADAGAELVPDPWVWSTHPDCSVPWRPDRVTGGFRLLVKRAKLDGIRFHDLRHMHATMLLDAGLPTSAVAARLGHAKESTTTDIYSHAIRRRDREAANLVGQLLDPAPDA
jgi:integrase